MKVTVLVRPKEGILDPQGEAIRQALTTLGYPGELGARRAACSTSSSTSATRRGRARRPRGGRPRARERPDRGLRGRGRGPRGRAEELRGRVKRAAHRRDHVPRDAATTATRCARSSWPAARPSRSGTPTPTSTAARGVIVPGGFSYGDYLRAGAIARFAPMMREVEAFAAAGGPVLGICNGFQVLCEAGLLPGVLRPNHHGRFVCRDVDLVVQRAGSPWLAGLEPGAVLRIPVKHHDGAWYAPPAEQRARRGRRPGRTALRRQPERRARRHRLRHERRRQRLRPDAAPRARGGRGARARRRPPAAARACSALARAHSKRAQRLPSAPDVARRDEVERVLDQLLDQRRRRGCRRASTVIQWRLFMW